MEAKAAGDGSLGQQVKLVSLDGRRELVARVAGFHEAVVTPGTGDETPPVGTGTGVRLLTRDK
jgi:hypothetical protein